MGGRKSVQLGGLTSPDEAPVRDLVLHSNFKLRYRKDWRRSEASSCRLENLKFF